MLYLGFGESERVDGEGRWRGCSGLFKSGVGKANA